jgi:MFS family permease
MPESSTAAAHGGPVSRREQRRVVFASSLGTVFEWYDFYLYATLAPFFAALFFPKDNETAALLSALATYAAGFLVRPFGALVFGRLGDLVGRKHTFLLTIATMGAATFAVGLLPTYSSIGLLAPVLLVALRLVQGLALGGEYGGAATYVAEHADDHRRGEATSWIQTTATLGFFLSMLVIGVCRLQIGDDGFKAWGWRLPFLLSLVLLVFSIYIRLRLAESPVFQAMKASGKGSSSPLRDSFLRWPNNKYVLLALFGATAGQGVVWYTGQFYALFFLQTTLKLGYGSAYTLVGLSLLIATPFYVVCGRLSDRIGRLPIILGGCVIAALTYFPLFRALTHFVNPALEEFQATHAITVASDDASFHVFTTGQTQYTPAERVRGFLTASGLCFETRPGIAGVDVVTRIGDVELRGWDESRLKAALQAAGCPAAADPARVRWFPAILVLVTMVLYVTMVYGPIAAYLVELFPTRIRYTSMSLPYHLGNGWFGGMLPLLATAMAAKAGNIYQGLWYPIAVAAMTAVIGALFLREQKGRSIRD